MKMSIGMNNINTMKIYKRGYVYMHRLVHKSSVIIESPAITTIAIIFTAIMGVIYLL